MSELLDTTQMHDNIINVVDDQMTNLAESNLKMKDSKNKVILISKDNVQFIVDSKVAKMSGLLKAMIDEYEENDIEELENLQELPLPNVSSEYLSKIIEYCTYYVNTEPMCEIEKPLSDSNLKVVVGDWYGDYIQKMNQETTFEVILASNFMDIKPLLDLSCASISSQHMGKTTAQIQEHFRELREANELSSEKNESSSEKNELVY